MERNSTGEMLKRKLVVSSRAQCCLNVSFFLHYLVVDEERLPAFSDFNTIKCIFYNIITFVTLLNIIPIDQCKCYNFKLSLFYIK